MDDALVALTLVTAPRYGLSAGALLAFSSFVMAALGRLPAAQGIAAMNSINVMAVTPGVQDGALRHGGLLRRGRRLGAGRLARLLRAVPDRRQRALYGEEQRMVFGANTYRLFARFERLRGSSPEADKAGDPWVTQMRRLPATVVSTTLQESLDWPEATLVKGDAVEVVARLKEESEVPLRSHGSVSMNRALMAAGLVDRLQLTIFPVITGQTGAHPIFQDAADFDLELIESRTFDGHIQELIYQPTLH